MQHVLYSYGNAEKISWVIKTNESTSEQNREHAEMYRNKVTTLQSKYIALHVGLFWGIGVFILRNNDSIKIKLDDKTMYDQITSDEMIDDFLIEKRKQFIKQLIAQRKFDVEFELISQDENLAKKNIESKRA